MWTGGFVALYDFVKGAPLTVARHAKVDAYYKKHGRFKNQPPSPPSQMGEKPETGSRQAAE
jgi:hypothetical protein